MARQEGLNPTAAEISKTPKLCDSASVVAGNNGHKEDIPGRTHEPFSLVKTDDLGHFLESKVVPFLDNGLTAEHIQDVIPATNFQALSISENLRYPPGRYPHWIFDLPASVDFARLEQACKNLVNHFDILRSVFVPAEAEGDNVDLHGKFWQVILREVTPAYDTVDARGTNDLSQLINEMGAEGLTRACKLGQSFIRFMAIKHTPSSSGSSSHKLVFRISNAYLDGFSWSKILHTLSSFYLGESQRAIPLQPSPDTPSFADYIAFRESRKQEDLSYWRNRLQRQGYPLNMHRKLIINSENINISWPLSDHLSLRHAIPLPSWGQQDGISPATRFYASFAFALSRFFGTYNLFFGRLATGRSALPASLQNVVGPTVTELPVTIWASGGVGAMAKKLQEQFVEESKYESVGMREIIEGATEWEYGRDWGWRTAYEQEDDTEFGTGTCNGNEEADEGEGDGLFGGGGIEFCKGEMQTRARPEVYATPDRKNGMLVLKFEGSKMWAKRMAIDVEGVKRFLVVLGLVLGGDTGPHVR